MASFITITSKKISNAEAFENISQEMNRTKTYMETKPRTNIDPSKSIQNEKLLENRYKSYEEFLDIKKQEIKQGNEKNITKYRMIKEGAATQYNFTIQSSREALTPKQHKEFLKECAFTLQEHFKDNEIIECHIHMDETTPHLHFCLSFFNKKRKKFNQKELLEEGKTKIDSIFKALEPVYKKYNLEKSLTLEQKVESLNEEDTNKLNEITKGLATEKEIKQAQKRFLKNINKYGGDAYTLPTILQNENHLITKKLNEDIKKSLEKLENLHIRDTNQIMENLKDWDKGIETSLFFKKKTNGYFITEEQYQKIISFHTKMSSIYREINEHNLLLQTFKTKIQALGLKDIKTIQEHQKTFQDIEKDIEILKQYKEEVNTNIKVEEYKYKCLHQGISTKKNEVKELENRKELAHTFLTNFENEVIEKKNILQTLDQKIEKMNNQARQAENNLIVLANTHEKAKETIKNIIEEEIQIQKNCEEMASIERQKIHKQAVQSEEEGKNDPEISLNKKWC